MAQGKYSPTVSKSYNKSQKWFEDYLDEKNLKSFGVYDKEGYDSYGYDENERDREGNREEDYGYNDALYEKVSDKWSAIPVIGSPDYLTYLKEITNENVHKVPEMLEMLEQVATTFEGKTESERALLKSIRALLSK